MKRGAILSCLEVFVRLLLAIKFFPMFCAISETLDERDAFLSAQIPTNGNKTAYVCTALRSFSQKPKDYKRAKIKRLAITKHYLRSIVRSA
jgi:hypothetical protein